MNYPTIRTIARRRASVKRLLFVFAMLILTPTVAHAQQAPCQFVLGFKTLHDLGSGDIGDCTDNQAFAPNGDAQQHTTKGLMAWRKADNWTAFTNGYMTWINGPNGLVSRLNTDRFPWEGDQASPVPTPTPPPQTSNPAVSVVQALEKAGLPIDAGTLRVYDAGSDPNNLLGRPGQYVAKVNFHDTRFPASFDMDIDSGGSVEAFATPDDLAMRFAYISAVARVGIFSEYDYLSKSNVAFLRVSHQLTPDQAAAYARALPGYVPVTT